MGDWKHRTTEEAQDALSRFCTRKAPVMTVPVDNERDADCILSDVIKERDYLELQYNELRKAANALLAKLGTKEDMVRQSFEREFLDLELLVVAGRGSKESGID